MTYEFQAFELRRIVERFATGFAELHGYRDGPSAAWAVGSAIETGPPRLPLLVMIAYEVGVTVPRRA